MASKELIDKLQIPTEEHRNPYSLQWLRPNDEVAALRQAFISFLIGPYHGEVICDVLPMDACHLLLERPWLYDNDIIYDGYANTYSLNHNVKNPTSAPLPPPKPHKAKLRKKNKKTPHKNKTREECATTKSNP